MSNNEAYCLDSRVASAGCQGNQGTRQQAKDFSLFTRRINSFSARGCGIVFGSLAGFSIVVAVVFSALGAWLILPFAGIEAIGLYLAYAWVKRHAQDSESLVIRGDAVALAVQEASQTRHYEFNRVWARLVVEQDNPGQGVRLALRSHGNDVEVGRYLDSSGRQRLARELKARLRAN
jgi:uncharacterized membrane protein